ncbi:MAG: phage portal protein [Oscillospiraceae bacterium]
MAENLSAFLAQNARKVENEKCVASQRFMGEDGKAVEWEICCITAGENEKLRKSCMRQVLVSGGRKGQTTTSFDAGHYQALISARCTVFPNLNSAELQDSYGVKSAEELITTMLTSGEFEDFSARVLEVNGFQNTEELVDEAKN